MTSGLSIISVRLYVPHALVAPRPPGDLLLCAKDLFVAARTCETAALLDFRAPPVTGNLTVIGTKSAAVAFPDGTNRALYCMESPELWFEDFGTVIKRGDYRVFVTPEGDCRGLYVRRKGGASFEVRELAGGKSSVAFSYRIVGRRKDVRAQRRLARVDTRLELSTAPARRPRKRSAAELRAFVARVEREMREAAPKIKKRPPLPRGLTRPELRGQQLLPDTE
jgi:hypothetical protein